MTVNQKVYETKTICVNFNVSFQYMAHYITADSDQKMTHLVWSRKPGNHNQTKDSIRTIPHLNQIQSDYILGDLEVTANLYCNFVYLYWEGCVICSIYLR